MNQLVKTKWVGHVTSLDGLTVSEHEFESPKGDNAQALTALLLRANLKAVSEARSIRMMEEGATKPRVYGKLDLSTDVAKASKERSDYLRFRVTLLPTPMSAHVVQIALCAENVFEALRNVMATYKVPTTEQAGAFVVESYSDSGALLVEMQKNRHQLEKAGYSFSGVTRLVVPKERAVVSPVSMAPHVPNWTFAGQNSTPTKKAEQSIATVLDILKQHSPVAKKQYTLKKD